MSHFTVLVIGDNPEDQLAPYHEFECTGLNDEYVQDIDVTDRARKDYEKDTQTMFEGPEGEMIGWDDPRIWRDPTPEEEPLIGVGSGSGNGLWWSSKDWEDGRGYRTKVLDEAFTKKEIPLKDTMSFEEYLSDWAYSYEAVPHGETPNLEESHKYGYYTLDENGEVSRVVTRTNPNSKWDWYQLGGRWRGFFQLKEGATGHLGEPGTFEKMGMREGKFEKYEPTQVDQALKGDIDFEAKVQARLAAELPEFDRAVQLLKDADVPFPKDWETIRDQICGTDENYDASKIREAREAYRAQPGMEVLNEDEKFRVFWGCVVEHYANFDRDRFELQVRRGANATFAVVKDGKWYEKGDMGWWGMVADEKEEEKWQEEYYNLLEGLPDDTLLSVYDCHI